MSDTERLEAAREAAWREAADTLAEMLTGFPMGGRHTRATWAVEYLRLMANRSERLRKFEQMAADTAAREPVRDDFAWLDPAAVLGVPASPKEQTPREA